MLFEAVGDTTCITAKTMIKYNITTIVKFLKKYL